MTQNMKQEALELLDKLGDNQIALALKYLRGLRGSKPDGKPQGRFADLCGTFAPDDVEIMRRVIEERERIDPDAW